MHVFIEKFVTRDSDVYCNIIRMRGHYTMCKLIECKFISYSMHGKHIMVTSSTRFGTVASHQFLFWKFLCATIKHEDGM